MFSAFSVADAMRAVIFHVLTVAGLSWYCYCGIVRRTTTNFFVWVTLAAVGCIAAWQGIDVLPVPWFLFVIMAFVVVMVENPGDQKEEIERNRAFDVPVWIALLLATVGRLFGLSDANAGYCLLAVVALVGIRLLVKVSSGPSSEPLLAWACIASAAVFKTTSAWSSYDTVALGDVVWLAFSLTLLLGGLAVRAVCYLSLAGVAR